MRYDPYLNNFQTQHPELALIAIASRHGETLDSIQSTITERSLNFPMVHDHPGRQNRRRMVYPANSPHVFLMDAQRKTLLYHCGAIDNFKYPEDPEYIGYLEPAIGQFLKGEPITRTETASYGCAIRSPAPITSCRGTYESSPLLARLLKLPAALLGKPA